MSFMTPRFDNRSINQIGGDIFGTSSSDQVVVDRSRTLMIIFNRSAGFQKMLSRVSKRGQMNSRSVAHVMLTSQGSVVTTKCADGALHARQGPDIRPQSPQITVEFVAQACVCLVCATDAGHVKSLLQPIQIRFERETWKIDGFHLRYDQTWKGYVGEG